MCRKCGKQITKTEIYKSTTCEHCGADLHSCVNCKFYAPGSHYDCHETIDELVKDKDRSNFCEHFSVFKGDFGLAGNSASDKASKAKDAFNALFE